MDLHLNCTTPRLRPTFQVKNALKGTMESFGFQILQCLVTDLNPDAKVKAAMNQINEATRMREANKEKAEAEKIQLVKAAEADCDAKKLSGEGVAKQRKAIVDGTPHSAHSRHTRIAPARP